ncbi:NAD(P)-dependent oxidoreductase [Mycoplasmatota bacterium zrk1]
MNKINVLLTGSTGFLGFETLKQLCSRNINKIYALYRSEEKRNLAILNLPKNNKIIFLKGDLDTFLVPSDVNVVIHSAAARPNICSNYVAKKVNVSGTKKLIEQLEVGQDVKFIYISTQAVYGALGNNITENFKVSPMTIYSKSKYEAELEVISNINIRPVILRISRIIGPSIFSNSDNIVSTIFPNKIIDNDPITLYGNVSKIVDLIDVRDVVSSIVKVVGSTDNSIIGETFNISSNKGITIEGVVECFIEWGKMNNTIVSVNKRDIDNKNQILTLCNDKAKDYLDWKPMISIEKSISDTMDYVIKNQG